MVLTRRQWTALSSISRLPNVELLTEIIDNVPAETHDLASICRVSKLLHALTLPFLNRDVVLVIYRARFVAFCSGLVENPTRGSAIRSFAIRGDTCASYLSVPALYPKLHLLYFPGLLTCKLSIIAIPSSYYTPSKQFLSRHKTLTSLFFHLGAEPSVPIPAISLPKLRHLEGPSHIFKDVVSQNISAMRVFWSDRSGIPSADLIDETVSRLKELTNPTAPFISYQDLVRMRETDCVAVLISLSHHMQHTTSLCVRAEDMKRIISLVSRLPRFSRLEYIALECEFRHSTAKTLAKG
ncbi:hypothetical protein FB45DRAFT_1060451 [Roridomyces roridus]|uniref:F-box domain-containing protein n=1 Tax=Roridomyces roridus TaxID=1738132 RepID=A0AAD7BN74_9AGAR|nr:hypothetical protein FB45DRAFT_1060451 [Roridomyces roridus]